MENPIKIDDLGLPLFLETSTRKPPFCCVHFDQWRFAHVPSRSKPVELEEPALAPVDLSKIADPWGEVVVDG